MALSFQSAVTEFGSEGSSTPVFVQPDAKVIGRGFDQLQPRTGVSNESQNDALREQGDLRSRLGSLLGDTSQTRRGEITQGFQGAGDTASRALQQRGIDPSLLGAQQGIQREQQLSFGDLSDQIKQRGIQNETGVSNKISDLLFGASGQATDLIGSLLNAGGIGNFSTSSNTPPTGTNLGVASGGPGEPFDGRFANQSLAGLLDSISGKGVAKRTGGGGGGGSSNVTNNPFVGGGGGGESFEGLSIPDLFDKLTPDRGPQETPDEFFRNQKILDMINALGAAQGGGGGSASPGPGNPTGLLAQSAAGTSSAISAGGSLA